MAQEGDTELELTCVCNTCRMPLVGAPIATEVTSSNLPFTGGTSPSDKDLK